MLTRPRRRTALPALAVASLALLTACGGSSEPAPGGTSAAAGRIDVVTSFYPLQYAVQRVGGDAVTVSNLTKPGAEPHDLELSPKDVAAVDDAGLVVYLSGFQPAVDDAVKNQAAGRAFDVASAATLDRTVEADEGPEAGTQVTDPHFWLDPKRLADVGDAIAKRLGEAQPAQADLFTKNAAALRTDLETLDAEFTQGLASCANKDLVTSHQAFGYLAARYGMTQVGITGLSPEAEPDAATLAKVTDFVRQNKVATIYYETLVSPDVAKTVAAETGAKTAVLDPLEGISDASAAQDYLGVMRANLAALRAGQPCT